MLRNYIKVAWRNLAKHKAFTLINVFGLSLSMSVCLVIISLVYDQYQYDQFHPKSDNTFRIITYKNGARGMFGNGFATSPFPFGKTLEERYPEINAVATFSRGLNGEIASPNKIFNIDGLYADPSFFEVFGFELLEGSHEESLINPFSIVLTEETALKLFPEGDALDKLVEFDDHGSYKVTGVMKSPPGKTNIQFDALGSSSSLPQLVERELYSDKYDLWENRTRNYNYVVLNDRNDHEEVEGILNEIGKSNIKLDDDHPGYYFEMQAFSDISPGKTLSNELGFALPKIALFLFSLLGIIVIITASINYANLSISKSLSRAKEIGIGRLMEQEKANWLLSF